MKKALFSLCIVFCPLVAFSIGVDVGELRSAPRIEFENYTGPKDVFQSDREIRGIGRDLASQAAKGSEVSRFLMKYTAIHAVDSAEPEKLSADIISIEKEATVDHVDNVRRVVSAYIERLYAYPRKDCDLLAVFVSYYNAEYRGRLDYFSGKYKTVVTKHLEAGRVGLSTKYYEWPGATQMVIPLAEKPKGDVLGALSTTELASKAVVEQLKGREDKGVTERKAMADLKEKEVERGRKKVAEDAKKLEEQKRKTSESEAALQKEKQAADRKKEEAEAAAAALEQEKRKGKTSQELESTQKDADRKAAEAGAAERAVKEKEAEIATAREEQKKQEERVAAGRKAVEEKKQEVGEEKKEIQRDETALRIQKEPEKVQKELEKKSEELATREKEVAKREEAAKKGESDASIFEGRLYYLKIKEYLTGGHYNNEMCAISAATAKVVQKSPIANICGHKYDIFKDGVVVITHKGDHRAGHYLTLLDLKTLESKATGADAVFWRSFVEVKEDLVYAVLNKDEKYYLGRFDAAMKTMAVSKDQVDPDSFISFFGDLIYINGSDKKILVLNREDLSTKGVVEP